MVRSFPRTPTSRLPAQSGVACTALLIAGVTAATPLAAADDKLKKRQHQAHAQVRGAQGDLHESSKALVAAAKRLSGPARPSPPPSAGSPWRRGTLDAAARLDAQMQARLQVAEHRLAPPGSPSTQARQRVADQRAAIGRLAASNYANGDPALMGLSVMLNSQDPAEVTMQMNTVTSLMSRQTTLLDELRTARARMVAEEASVEKARAAVAVQRKAAAENLVRKQGLERPPRRPAPRWPRWSSALALPRSPLPGRARPTSASCAPPRSRRSGSAS